MFHISKLVNKSTAACTKVFIQETITVLISAQQLLLKDSNYSLNHVRSIVSRTTVSTPQHNDPKNTHTYQKTFSITKL